MFDLQKVKDEILLLDQRQIATDKEPSLDLRRNLSRIVVPIIMSGLKRKIIFCSIRYKVHFN